MGYFLGKREGMPADLMSILQKAGGVGGVSNPGQGVFKIPGLGATGGTPVPLGQSGLPGTLGSQTPPGCRQNSDCPPGQECVAGTCKDTTTSGDCVPGKPCKVNTDCAAGKCIGASLTQRGKCDCKITCTNDSGCPAGQKCINGICYKLGEEITCKNDADCQSKDPNMRCVNGKCTKDTGGIEGCIKTCATDYPDPNSQEYKDCVNNCNTTGDKCRNVRCSLEERCDPKTGKCVKDEFQTCLQSCKSRFPDETSGNYQQCVAECSVISRPCLKDEDCPEGQKCKNGKCEITYPGECGKGKVTTGAYPNGREWEGCECSAAYYPNEGEPCIAGYHQYGSGADFRCECDKYNPGDGGGDLGAYDFPPELKALFAQLIARAQDLLGRKPGFSDTFLTNLFGQNMDKIRGAGAASNQGLMSQLQTEGMLGTGAGNQQLQQGAWNTQRNVGETLRDIGVANEGQKRTDLQTYTNLASQLGGQGAGFEQLRETINAGRRGEGQNSLALLLQYLMGLMSGYNQ